MKTYTIAVSLLLSVEAPDQSDALEAVKDTFGEGEICGIDIKDVEVEVIDEL
ncbi:hypothetical protein SEA_DAUBENSKI_142 [Streptomyces phage Daubenski]|jgi:hypothetical protein|uniref:Uncharacterized protein n=4 Tax=Samistivirus TaxID=2560220 RepID=A0A514U205_9CAUD|nr:hypothetical protein FDI36_gp132 [Streptomyces phage NootNoot]YP_009611116.1 hypothetical protein FDI37_gp129 [Streptomyces phage Paradiddles]YP_010104020.1 hypothetical protein KNU71_gp136 [Streptomyces phage Braelyn]YP_010104889.1 hypothetical protein KNU80_gp140 [Streptomyces phage Daubenski]UGL63125.1 hypothetical protein SEA_BARTHOLOMUNE_142 [Streptomyces phage Bartholomune]UOW93557.1 hypothetical protein SEA_SQUILLIUM_142 [Streptomyces phage Squillium]WNM73008.1 hypothetical protein 